MRLWRRSSDRPTQRLSRDRYVITVPQASRYGSVLLLAGILACGAAYALVLQSSSDDPSSRVAQEKMQQEVNRLQHELQLGELRLQQEIATREELARQVESQSQKLRQAEQELVFFRSRAKAAAQN